MTGDKVAAALDAVYAEIPSAGCKGLCVDSCGSIGMTPVERDRIRDRHGVDLPLLGAFAGGHCPALVDGRCSVYADRPTVCRLWGAVEALPCEYGCVPDGGHLPARDGARLHARVEVIQRRVERGKYE